MKPLKNHVLIYDAECPMCALYTGAFTQYGWLEKNGRWKYEEIEKFEGCAYIDRHKSRHEIALVDLDNKKVHYGLDSILFILAYHLPFLKFLFQSAAFQVPMKQVYSLISYNRKVIAPATQETEKSCIPDFHLFYRWLYVVLALAIALAVFYWFGNMYQIAIPLVFGVAIFSLLNILGSLYFMRVYAVIYIGQLATILLIACLLLVLIGLLIQLFGHFWLIESVAYLLASIILLKQIIRRSKIALRDYQNTFKNI
jgi:predicted DCC family thiol-disulfide oxidoreductase YuxK